MYESGAPLRAIASELGMTMGFLSMEMYRLRKAGQVGYRYNVRKAA